MIGERASRAWRPLFVPPIKGEKVGTRSVTRYACLLAVLAAVLGGALVGGADARSPEPQAGKGAASVATKATAVKTGSATYAPMTFDELPGWSADDHLAAFKAFLASCPKVQQLARGNGRPGRRSVPADLVAACEEAQRLPAKPKRTDARLYFERHFRPHRVLHGSPNALFTGYYEPLIEGSRTRGGRFQAPLLKRPTDLVDIVEPAQRSAVGGQLTHARQTRAGLVPFATRADIEAGALDGQGLELIWLADPVEVFFLQIQGSGRVRLTDGTTVRVHYDGKNGHPYTSIGRYLIDKGLLAADRVSMGALGRWLKADAARGRLVMHQNKSYVFFRELADSRDGPLGALEVPLTAGRSLAVDPAVHTLGTPVYVSAPSLTHPLKGRPYNRLMIAQDVGSAIKGAERGDIFFGSGDSAGRTAGITKHPGHFFVLLARKPEEPIATGSTSKPKRVQR